MSDFLKCFIGYDSRENEAYLVCKHSLARHSTESLSITPLVYFQIPEYRREFEIRDGIKYDLIDGKPFSTEFSFTRFLVPYLCKYKGWALFCDSDMMVTRDIREVFDLRDEKYAVMCVKHDYRPKETVKMDGQVQEQYPRKNWSSFVLWNCGHPSNVQLTPDIVNTATGAYLHSFAWLKDEEIGSLPGEWNYLVGHDRPANIHYTMGIPSMRGYEDCEFAPDWWRAYHEVTKK